MLTLCTNIADGLFHKFVHKDSRSGKQATTELKRYNLEVSQWHEIGCTRLGSEGRKLDNNHMQAAGKIKSQ